MSAENEQTVDWGLTAYTEAMNRQLDMVDKRRSEAIPDTLILTEHPPVYTVGARRGADQHLVWGGEQLRAAGIEVVRTNRGGDITYHGPGQLVGYPIISLREKKDLHGYLRDLEEVLIRTVGHFGLEATRREGKTGIWLGERKLAAIGVAVRSWVTYHGFALNVEPDLGHFRGIVPCGITDGTVTSLAMECLSPPLLGQVKSRLVLEFWDLFGDRCDNGRS